MEVEGARRNSATGPRCPEQKKEAVAGVKGGSWVVLELSVLAGDVRMGALRQQR